MARVTTVTKSRTDQGTCGRCGAPLPAGTGYRWAQPGFRGRKLVRCTSSTCYFRQSELTTSHLSTVYAAQEDLQEAIDAWDGEDVDDLKSALDDAAEAAQEGYDAYDEANSEWESTSGAENEEWVERRDSIETWQEALRDVDFEDKPEPEEPDEDVGADEAKAEHEEAIENWVDECRQKAQDACDELEV